MQKKFDGFEDPKSMECIPECDGGGMNINVYEIGDYDSCNYCGLQEHCRKIRPKQKT